jgi:hypothetical protein
MCWAIKSMKGEEKGSGEDDQRSKKKANKGGMKIIGGRDGIGVQNCS